MNYLVVQKIDARMKMVLFLCSLPISIYVTASGWSLMFSALGLNIGIMRSYLMAVAISFLTYNPMLVKAKSKQMGFNEFLPRITLSLLLDVLAVYVILPWALDV